MIQNIVKDYFTSHRSFFLRDILVYPCTYLFVRVSDSSYSNDIGSCIRARTYIYTCQRISLLLAITLTHTARFFVSDFFFIYIYIIRISVTMNNLLEISIAYTCQIVFKIDERKFVLSARASAE